MSLTRTSTQILLKSNDGSYYWVGLTSAGDAITLLYSTVPQVSTSDEYVALRATNGSVYRWSLETLTLDGDTIVNSILTLSPDQSESSVTSISISYNGTLYAVGVLIVQADGTDVPTLSFGLGASSTTGSGSARIGKITPSILEVPFAPPKVKGAAFPW